MQFKAYFETLNLTKNRTHGIFLKRGKEIYFHYWIYSKRFTYSTKMKIEYTEWDLKKQRPKARRGQTGQLNRNITHELNEYQKIFDDLKSYYKESLSMIVKMFVSMYPSI